MPRGEEGGTLDFKWQGWLSGGKNQNPQKFLDQNLTPQKFHAQFPSHKNFQKALKWYNMKDRNVWSVCVFLFIHSRDTRELSRIFRLFWIPPKKSLPKSTYQKNTCQNFPTQKISRNQKFQTQKNPSIIPVPWNPENPHWEAKFTIMETFCSGMKTILDLHVGLLITLNKWDFCMISVMERSWEAPIL